jgi:pimeloyl-ACP methyl ester carboxylesterase
MNDIHMEQTRAPVSFDTIGPATAPAIVFLHCTAANRKLWLPQMERLADQFHVIAPDLPGHGALAEQPFRLDTACQYVGDVIDRIARRTALVVGLSLGGYVAMELARQTPGRVAGLVLSGCIADFSGITGTCVRRAGLLLKASSRYHVIQAALGQLIRKLLNRSVQKGIHELRPPSIAETILAADLAPQAIVDVLLALAGKDFRPTPVPFQVLS